MIRRIRLIPRNIRKRTFRTITSLGMSEADRGVKPTLLELAVTFNHIALASFGGRPVRMVARGDRRGEELDG